MAWIYCRAASTARPALVGADRWSALRLAQPSTHGVDLLPSGFYCRACPGGCRPLVGTEAGPAIHAWRGSTAERLLLPGLPWWVPTVVGTEAGPAIHAWRASTAERLLLPGLLWWVPTLVGTEAGPAIHAWRGSTAEPAAGCSPAPGGAVSVVLTADGRSLPSVPSWLGPLPFRGGWPDAVRSFGPVASTHGVDLLPTLVGSNVCRPRTAPTGAACPRRDLPAGTGRHCWRHNRCWQCCHAPAG